MTYLLIIGAVVVIGLGKGAQRKLAKNVKKGK